MKTLTVFLCLGYVLVSSVDQYTRHDWTKLILTHHWPKTFCTMEHCSANFSYWTLHGFWPNVGNECNSSWHFNASLIEDLLPEMKTFWPDLLKPASTSFWKHEWQKHGTCAAKDEDLNSQHKYFSKALELYHKLDLNGVLKKSQIVPSEKYYKLADLEEGIINSYGVTPKIQCVLQLKGSDTQTLGQIEICVDKQFQLTDCEKTTDELQITDNEVLPFLHRSHPGFTVCDPSVPVYYPPVTATPRGKHFLRL
ncbi:ribonuclease T2 [Salminus brasiliensis]|uniref:ribonuclease T2 n=1 Tax=Salminus brasiliensis TaxID=930266 RepID=UPI003B83954A